MKINIINRNNSYLVYLFIPLLFIYILSLTGCSTGVGVGSGHIKSDSSGSGDGPTSNEKYNPHIPAGYLAIAPFADHDQWGSHNVHDPSVIKVGNEYYMFSTDVAYGANLDRIGIQVRKSKNLVHWKFVGWAFKYGIPPKEMAYMSAHQAGYKKEGVWAPFIMKVGDTFRLYYAVPGNNGLKLAVIGLATSKNILGPWKDRGIVIATTSSDPINSIDPSVIVDQKQVSSGWFTVPILPVFI